MKRIYRHILVSLMILSLGAIGMQAKQIDPETAMQNAMTATQKMKGKKKAAPLAAPGRLTLKHTVYDSAANPLFYIFSRGENAGYVIASAEDRARPVLAVTTRGNFTGIDELPDPVKYLLDTYTQELTMLVAQPDNGEPADAEETYRDPIDPLLESWWGQDAPFNMYCPVISGLRAPVGCVGLANAMVINYHQYPPVGTGTFTYTSGGKTETYVMEDNPFDYDNILPYYSGHVDEDETLESQQAVANLCFAAAIALGSNFKVDGTASSLSSAPFASSFKYPTEGLGRLTREFFTIEEWEEIVYEELANNRPVVYGGKNGQMGHAFVVDGYEDGLFSINWGWYGDADAYFSLTSLRPGEGGTGSNSDNNYSVQQDMIRGVRTPSEPAASPLFTSNGVSYLEDADQFELATLTSRSGYTKVELGVELTGTDNDNYMVIRESDSKVFDASNTGAYTFNIDFKDVPDGKYRVRPVVKLAPEEEKSEEFDGWYQIYCLLKGNRYCDVEIKDGSILTSKAGSDVVYNIRFDEFYTDFTLTYGDLTGFTMRGTNNGNTFLATVLKKIYHRGTDIEAVTSTGRETVGLEPGASAIIPMALNNDLRTPGEYDLEIVDADDPSIVYSDRIPFTLLSTANAKTVDGIKYVIISEEDREVRAVRGGTIKAEMDIPETVTIDGVPYSVTEIGINFGNSSSTLKKLTLPSTLKKISPSAFMNCANLEEVNLPESLIYLGGNAFGSCKALTTIELPAGIGQILNNTFRGAGLTSVTIPEGITGIGQDAFSMCKFTSVTLPSTMESIGDYAFNGMNLRELVCKAQTPPALQSNTFAKSCYTTAKLIVPAEVVDAYRKAEYWKNFTSTGGLTSEKFIVVDNLWYEITPGYEAILTSPQDGTAYSIERVTIPAAASYLGVDYKVIAVAEAAFKDVKSIVSAGGGDNVATVGAHAFEGTSITSLSLPPNVVEIGDYAYAGTKASTITSFPETLRKVGKYAFADNPALTYRRLITADYWLDLPVSIEEIGDGAFANCTSLNTLRFNADITLGENVFANTTGMTICSLNSSSLSEDFVRNLQNQIKAASFYIDPALRDYYSPMFDGDAKLYNLLTSFTVDEEANALEGISNIKIKSNDKFGNPKLTYAQMTWNFFTTAGYAQVDSYDTFSEEGYFDLVVTPIIEQNNIVISLTFEQPGLFLQIPVNVAKAAKVISKIEIEEEETINLRAGDSYNITYSYMPDDPTDGTLIWSSSDESVATVEATGKVTAVSNGTAVISCRALRGVATASCSVQVGDDLAWSIVIEAPTDVVTLGRPLQLAATVTPEEAENNEVVWSSSATDVATVDSTGLVTGLKEGEVTITATAKNESKVTADITLKVAMPTAGKAVNEDEEDSPVNIIDVVAICQHILDTDVENFNKWGADANRDGSISVSDVNTTVKIIMDGEDSDSRLEVRAASEESGDNYLNFGEIIFENSDIALTYASLEAADDFTALQADIICPENVEIANISLHNLSSHTLNWRKLGNGNYRIVVYSLTNELLPVAPSAMLELTLNKVGTPSGAMGLTGAWLSTPGAVKAGLYASGGTVEVSTGIGSLGADFTEPTADVFTIEGALIRRNADVSTLRSVLAPGIYILRGRQEAAKIVVK